MIYSTNANMIYIIWRKNVNLLKFLKIWVGMWRAFQISFWERYAYGHCDNNSSEWRPITEKIFYNILGRHLKNLVIGFFIIMMCSTKTYYYYWVVFDEPFINLAEFQVDSFVTDCIICCQEMSPIMSKGCFPIVDEFLIILQY